MSDTISNAKEIYYSFRDEQGVRKLTPVRGVYVTGEWKPPMYMEPILQVLEFKTNKCLIQEYIETNKTVTSDTSHHLYDVDIDSSFRIDVYSTATAPTQTHDTTHHLYDVDIDSRFHIDYYQTTNVPTQTHDTTHHLYDVEIDGSFQIVPKSTCIGGSFPEPILRVIEYNVTAVTIEDLS